MVTMALTSCSPAAAPAMAAIGSAASRYPEPSSCRAAGPCSSFFGAEVHASAVSPVFQQEKVSIRRLQIQPRRSRRGSQNLVVRSLFGLGVPELAVIAGVAAILFGPKKLPEIGKSLGKTVKSFQQDTRGTCVAEGQNLYREYFWQAAKEFETEIKNPSAEAPGTENTNVEKPAPTPVSTPTSTSTAGSDRESP